MAVSTPASARRSSAWSISARPPTRTSGFGKVSVIGRMRWPRPAASTMAVRSEDGSGLMGANGSQGLRPSRRGRPQPGQVGFVPAAKFRQGGVTQVPGECGFDTRQVLQVLGLAVALVEADEDADDLRRALRPEDRVGAGEGVHVELGVCGLAVPRVGAE